MMRQSPYESAYLSSKPSQQLRAIVDRIEMTPRGGVAVLEFPDASYLDWPLSLLPQSLKEADVLYIEHRQGETESHCHIRLDPEARLSRLAKARALRTDLAEIFSSQNQSEKADLAELVKDDPSDGLSDGLSDDLGQDLKDDAKFKAEQSLSSQNLTKDDDEF
ncbi:MAG: DUF3006 domain-containing protein [Deinococcales bacterium]